MTASRSPISGPRLTLLPCRTSESHAHRPRHSPRDFYARHHGRFWAAVLLISTVNPFRIRTSAKCTRNSFRIRTSKSKGLKASSNHTLTKKVGGGGKSVNEQNRLRRNTAGERARTLRV